MLDRKQNSFALRRAIIKGFHALGIERKRGQHPHLSEIPFLVFAPQLIQNPEAIKNAMVKQTEEKVA